MATVQSSYRTQLRGSLENASSNGGTQVMVSTASVVSHLNQQLFAFTSPEKFTTFVFGIFDEGANILSYTNAGHLPAIFLHQGEPQRLEVNGMVIGAFPFSNYDSSEIRMQSGDLLLFFTDGITEPENAYGEMFGEERLIDMLVKNQHLDDEALISTITTAVRQWSGTEELQDDMTLLLIRRL